MSGHSSAVTSLIQANASVNIKNKLGRTALYYGKSSLIKLSTVWLNIIFKASKTDIKALLEAAGGTL